MNKVLIIFIVISFFSGCGKNNVKTDNLTSNKEDKVRSNQDFNENNTGQKSDLIVVNCQIMFENGAYGMLTYKIDLSDGINPHLFFCKKNMKGCRNGLNLSKMRLPEKPYIKQPGNSPPYETDACFTIEKQ